MGWRNPQEDEFALLNMGVPSPYRELAFPNHRKRAAPFLSLDEFSPRDRTRWCKALMTFLKSVTLYRMKQAGGIAPRLVLKSPPHTARLAALSEMFPEAKFIHLVRNPAEVFPSSVRTWATLFEVQGCQTPRAEALPNGSCIDRGLCALDLQRALPRFRAGAVGDPRRSILRTALRGSCGRPLYAIAAYLRAPSAWSISKRRGRISQPISRPCAIIVQAGIKSRPTRKARCGGAGRRFLKPTAISRRCPPTGR